MPDRRESWEPREEGHREPPPYVDLARSAFEAERESLTADKLALAEEKLRLVDEQKKAAERVKPPWWGEWLKPAPILAALAVLFGAFQVYQSDKASIQSRFQEQSAALVSIANEVHSNYAVADDRAKKYVPDIEKMKTFEDAQKMLNDQTSDRFNNVASSMRDLRTAVDGLTTAVQKMHEDMMVDRAKREHEGRIGTPHGAREPSPANEDATLLR